MPPEVDTPEPRREAKGMGVGPGDARPLAQARGRASRAQPGGGERLGGENVRRETAVPGFGLERRGLRGGSKALKPRSADPELHRSGESARTARGQRRREACGSPGG